MKWTLRKDLFWGDGVPVTTKDIAYTAKAGGDIGSGFPDARAWGRVRSLDIVDDQNVVLHLDEVTPLYNRMGKPLKITPSPRVAFDARWLGVPAPREHGGG